MKAIIFICIVWSFLGLMKTCIEFQDDIKGWYSNIMKRIKYG